MLRAVCAALALALLVAAPAGSQDLAKGGAAYERGDYATALKEFGMLAAIGDAEAQNAVGFMYYRGDGVPRDYKESRVWFHKAAEQGLAKAQYNLAVLYAKGQGTPQDLAEAVKWYRKAAEQGLARAQYNLGLRYERGEGVPADYVEAAKWYGKAAAQGHAGAKAKLAALDTKHTEAAADKPMDGEKYYVQLGSVRTRAVAEGEADRLNRALHSVLGALKVVTVRADLGDSGVFYRLVAGPLPDRAGAESLCRRLAGPEQGCVVIKS